MLNDLHLSPCSSLLFLLTISYSSFNFLALKLIFLYIVINYISFHWITLNLSQALLKFKTKTKDFEDPGKEIGPIRQKSVFEKVVT